jgi:uncharacterized protein YdcH (DUF465 family)
VSSLGVPATIADLNTEETNFSKIIEDIEDKNNEIKDKEIEIKEKEKENTEKNKKCRIENKMECVK